jgi:bacterioferritin-associated ferredoxin
MYLCICNAVTESAARECAQAGACSIEDLAFQLGVGAGCGRCRECATEMLRGLVSDSTTPAVAPT